VAFTFDDGPGAVTGAVLEALAAHGARATFHVLGERVAGREATLRRIRAAGHELGSHAFHHRRLAGRPLDAARQLVRTSRAVARAAGVRPRVFRAPYGSTSPGVVRAAALLGMTTVGWDVDPRDYETPGAGVLRDRMLAGIAPGSIVCLHDDRRARQQTAEALDAVLPVLRERGLGCVTVSELLGL
jgi:peptidoglycan/xylan/chitin deacetylase (PgdA/CDA1 family)